MKEFDAIIGYDEIRTELMQTADALRNREIYKKLGATAPNGLMLYGDPGVGKTLMAKSLIAASGLETYTCRKDMTESQLISAIKEVFQNAAANAPAIVFLDDMDKFSNNDDDHMDADVFVTIQSCIDEYQGSGIFVLATVNDMGKLPRSLKRAGRFDRMIKVDKPRSGDVEDIIKHYLGNKRTVADMDIAYIARLMDGNSCAELETVINEAARTAAFRRADSITMEHFTEACLRTVYGVNPGTSDSLRKSDLADGNNMQTQVIYHEAGHAAVSELLSPGSVIAVLTEIGGGKTKGRTISYRDGSLNDMEWAEYQIMSALGGRAALDIRFGITDMGAVSDINDAFELVHDLVAVNCVSGLENHDSYRIFSGEASPDIKNRLELLVAYDVERYYRKVRRLLIENRDMLDRIACKLAETGLLTMRDVQRIREPGKEPLSLKAAMQGGVHQAMG